MSKPAQSDYQMKGCTMSEIKNTVVETVETDDTNVEETEEAKRGRKAYTRADLVARSNAPTILDRAKLRHLSVVYGVTIDDNAMRVMILAESSPVRNAWLKSQEYKDAQAEIDAAIYEQKRVTVWGRLSENERKMIAAMPKDQAENFVAMMIRMMDWS